MGTIEHTKPDQPVPQSQISGHPLPGWRTKMIESHGPGENGELGWSVILERDKGAPIRARRVVATSTIGLFHCWDQAVGMARQINKEHPINA